MHRKLTYCKIIYTLVIGFVLCQTVESLLSKLVLFIVIAALVSFGFSVFKTLWGY